ncbi:mitochondrial dicarboxylate transporter [Rhizodiscina lignyota]|uniref:Mitochondrial dicarboxylate transporter n=1 Tax=Rhizodiscina lignyota TaxID=1504668 RepID=A0A9P4M1K5_9PEZI|nr:mitochondrial dicarboxylate transporter [Rhizodiscina lignyota]
MATTTATSVPIPKVEAKKIAREPFWLGGAAGSMAACFTHPLDQTKYRLQVLTERPPLLRAVYNFAARDGILSLWNGLSASILRQSTYSTARFGLYNLFASHFKPSSGQKLSPGTTMACAGLAGGIAGCIGNPAEIVLVRMCADGAKAPAERYGYSNALTGLVRVGREDGFRTYFRGLGPNVVRSILMNVSQIFTYTEAKARLLSARSLGLKDDTKTHMLASLIAGTVATTACAPADVLKSRVQNMSRAEGGQQSVMRYCIEIVKKEGPLVLMKGWTPAWLRLTPYTILTFVFMEKLRLLVGAK